MLCELWCGVQIYLVLMVYSYVKEAKQKKANTNPYLPYLLFSNMLP